MFQKGTRFAASSSKDSPEKTKVSVKTKESSKPSKKLHSTPKRVPASSASPEVRAISSDFVEFLNRRLDRSAVSDVSRQIKTVIDKIQSVMTSSSHATPDDSSGACAEVEELSSYIQEFYLNFVKRL